VSGASGAVGHIAVQLFKLCGCHVVGTTRSLAEKGSFLQSLGVDAIVDIHQLQEINTPAASVPLQQSIKEACPDGIDIFFDLVGGLLLDCVICTMNPGGRIITVGQAAANDPQPRPYSLTKMQHIISNQLCLQGFSLEEFPPHRHLEALRRISSWLAAGKLVAKEHVVPGFKHVGEGLSLLLSGNVSGKILVKAI